jgi:hypothetical protein
MEETKEVVCTVIIGDDHGEEMPINLSPGDTLSIKVTNPGDVFEISPTEQGIVRIKLVGKIHGAEFRGYQHP